LIWINAIKAGISTLVRAYNRFNEEIREVVMKSTVIRSAAIATALVVYLTAPAFALDKAPILSLD